MGGVWIFPGTPQQYSFRSHFFADIVLDSEIQAGIFVMGIDVLHCVVPENFLLPPMEGVFVLHPLTPLPLQGNSSLASYFSFKSLVFKNPLP